MIATMPAYLYHFLSVFEDIRPVYVKPSRQAAIEQFEQDMKNFIRDNAAICEIEAWMLEG